MIMFDSRQTSVLASVMLLSAACEFPDSRSKKWPRIYDGHFDDVAYSVQTTAGGGYVILGTTTALHSLNNDLYLIKTDDSGEVTWTRAVGGVGNEWGFEVRQLADGGYIAAGSVDTLCAYLEMDMLLVKFDGSGNVTWSKTFGGVGRDDGRSVVQTEDGGYLLAGYTACYGAGLDDVYLVKTNALGETVWTRTLGGTGWDQGFSIQRTTDDGYIVAGRTTSFGSASYDVYLVKIDAIGDTAWTRRFGGASSDEGRSVQQTSDGGYIVAGSTYSYGAGLGDVYLVRVDVYGETIWTRTFGGSGDDMGMSVQQTTDGGYIVAGSTFSYGAGRGDVFLIKADDSGNVAWTSTYGRSGYDGGYSVQQTTDGGYIIAGRTESNAGSFDVYLIKTDALGNVGP